MKRAIFGLVLALVGLSGGASASAACVFAKAAELPVTMRGLRPTISAQINGKDATFIVDTGAFFSTVSDEAVTQFGMKATMAPVGLRVRGVGGGSAAARVTRALEFRFGGVPFKNVEFLVADRLGGDQTAGLIGQNVLGSMDIEYDLANGYIRFFKATGCDKANLAYWSAGKALSRLPLKEADGPVLTKILTTARIDGKSIKVSWDSGTPLSILSRPAASRVGVHSQSEAVTAGGVSYGLFGKGMETSIAPFGSFAIGDEEVRNTQLRVADIELPDADMLLGADFFLSHRILVSRSQGQIYFTYNGGPVFRLDRAPRSVTADAGAPVQGASEGPRTAAEFALRGSASLSRRDYSAAIADFSKAIELEPKEGRHYRERAMARLASGNPILGMADLGEALKLKPDDLDTLMTRGALYLGAKDEARGRQDLDAARKLAPQDTQVAMRIGAIYAANGAYGAAVREFDRWLEASPGHIDAAQVLNQRCWTRAQWGRELEAALADCDLALKKGGRNSAFMDSRGLVLLRLGRLDEAIVQYDAAIKAQPKQAWSLYGRGVAKLRKGDKAGGQADIAAANAISPTVADEARRIGVTPAAS